MGQALYRKYRSKSLGEVIGQEHVTTTLKNALKAGRVSHAYLLSGPRGTGKTSIARILAHEINNLPYDDKAHLDIIEIDAASNRRIDEIRDLRDRVSTAPANAKYKVYIIDEIHMLTREAFNALLKTLEEPPAHVVFILATTEAHKLPETILSRTQRYSLRPVALPQVVGHLRTIADGEKLQIDANALELIAEHGEGSFRDSISLLDQASSVSDHITRADVEQILGLAPAAYIVTLATALAAGSSASVVSTLTELHTQGYEPAAIAQQLGAYLRTELLEGRAASPEATLYLLQKLLDVPAARNPRQLLEIVLLQTALPPAGVAAVQTVAQPAVAVAVPTVKPAIQPVVTAPVAAKPVPAPVVATTPPKPAPPAAAEPVPELPPVPSEPITDITELWQQTLGEIKNQYNTLYGIARMAQVEMRGNVVTISLKFIFHQKRLNEAKNRKIVAEVIERLYGQPIEIKCVVAEDVKATSEGAPSVNAISDIFGGAELIQS
jgi:DNA polymerase-3 subunit gamma/tau